MVQTEQTIEIRNKNVINTTGQGHARRMKLIQEYFKCSGCDYGYTRKDIVQKHIEKVHKGGKFEVVFVSTDPLKCTICEFTTGRKRELDEHVREVHDGKKQFVCTICNR